MKRSCPAEITIGKRRIGEGHPVYVILEAGSNWLDLKRRNDPEYGFKQAKKMIQAAKDAGADAVKFQIFRARDHISSRAKTPRYLKKTGKRLYDIIQELELPRPWVARLAGYARKQGIDFITSPCDREAVELLLKTTQPPAFKVASFDIVDLPFLRFLASKGKPVILSTGMASVEEIRDAVHAVRSHGNPRVCLLHCISSYPAPKEQVCLRSIAVLKDRFGLPTGFSDHTQDTWTASLAVAAGACIIEKHFTLDRRQKGPDHPFALEPDEAAEMIRRIRETEASLGRAFLGVRKCERQLHATARRCLVLGEKGIEKGEVFRSRHFVIKRGDGILPKDISRVLGRKAKRSYVPDEILHWEDL